MIAVTMNLAGFNQPLRPHRVYPVRSRTSSSMLFMSGTKALRGRATLQGRVGNFESVGAFSPGGRFSHASGLFP